MTRSFGDIESLLESSALMESLASLEHERWSHWQRYLHSKCIPQEDGSLVIPQHLARQWNRQIETSYENLSEQEKESDREQVKSYLPTIKQAIADLDK